MLTQGMQACGIRSEVKRRGTSIFDLCDLHGIINGEGV